VNTPSPASPSTLIRLAGADALALLHRISTQALEDLGRSESRATLFCDFRGRLQSRAHVARVSDDSVWLVAERAPGAELAAFLDRHIFREDVKLDDWSARCSIRGRLEAGATPGTPVAEADGRPTKLAIAPGAALEVLPATAPAPTEAELYAWEVARIEAARPRHGREIAEAFNPYEVGLADEVHLSKGCYTGQEVLQRLITYSSVRRGLARVSGPGAAPVTPVPACIADERVGTVTSAVESDDGWIGLAVISARGLEARAEVGVEDGAKLRAIEPVPAAKPRGLPEATGQAR
jgi:folate-binding protein YgfZ